MKSLAVTIVCLLLSSTASAVVIYDFEGLCAEESDCNGVATAVLTLADTYTPGTALAFADFVSIYYSSSQGSFQVPDGLAFVGISGVLPDAWGMPIESVIIDFEFDNSAVCTSGAPECGPVGSGIWNVQYFPVGIGDDGGDYNDRDHGTSYSWTLRTVPEPSSLALLGAGLIGLTWRRRRT